MDKISLTALAREQLAAAHRAASGRSAHTVYGGHQHQPAANHGCLDRRNSALRP